MQYILDKTLGSHLGTRLSAQKNKLTPNMRKHLKSAIDCLRVVSILPISVDPYLPAEAEEALISIIPSFEGRGWDMTVESPLGKVEVVIPTTIYRKIKRFFDDVRKERDVSPGAFGKRGRPALPEEERRQQVKLGLKPATIKNIDAGVGRKEVARILDAMFAGGK